MNANLPGPAALLHGSVKLHVSVFRTEMRMGCSRVNGIFPSAPDRRKWPRATCMRIWKSIGESGST